MATRYSISTIPYQIKGASFDQEVTRFLVKNGYNWPLKLEEKDKAMTELVAEFGVEVLEYYSASPIV